MSFDMDLNRRLVFTVIAAAVGSGFQHGYHTGVINIPAEVLRTWENGTMQKNYGHYLDATTLDVLWAVTTSMMNVGGTIGGFLTMLTCSIFGPKGGLFYINILVIIATILMGIAKYVPSVELMIIGRLVIGVNCGLNAGLCPMYLSEISPTSLRGALASCYQLVITIAILIAQIIGLHYILGTEDLWPILFIIPIAVSLFQIATLVFCPESPKYLVNKGDQDERAEKALCYLRHVEDVGEELAEIKAADADVKALPKVTVKEMFTTKSLRRPLIIALGVMMAQQLSGINAVIFYSTDTFRQAGLSEDAASFATLGIGVVNVAMTIVSVFLVEIAGRKTLLLIGFGGMAIGTLLLAIVLYFAKDYQEIAYAGIALIIIYIILFAAGAGSIPWFLVAEIFNQAARPTAISMAVPTNWICNIIVTLLFPILQGAIGAWVFLIFVVLNSMFFAFILIKVPETKNKSIEEITKLFE